MYIYYVYAYLRDKDSVTANAGTPYYIGKGKNKRATQAHKNIPVPKDNTLIQFIAINLNEHEAHLLEQKLITLYGRKDLYDGILLNRTNGGAGSSGTIVSTATRLKLIIIRKNVSDATRLKLSLASKGHIVTAETRHKLSTKQKGKIVSTESKLKMSESAKLRKRAPHSNETKLKMSESAKSNKNRNK